MSYDIRDDPFIIETIIFIARSKNFLAMTQFSTLGSSYICISFSSISMQTSQLNAKLMCFLHDSYSINWLAKNTYF